MHFEVTEARYKGQYRIDLTFEDGSSGTADLGKFLEEGTVFAKLKDETRFRTFSIEYGTIVWKTENLDIAPETLYSEATGKHVRYQPEGVTIR
jgi:hypothetical protein